MNDLLDEEQEVVITVDDQRSVSVTPTKDGEQLVLSVEDPHSVAIVGMKKPDIVALYEALEDWLKR